MKYREITPAVGDRFRLPPSHPYLVALSIEPADWFDFERLDADNPATRILGHDAPRNGQMNVYVGCASAAVQDRLADGWG
jgi:hypothetical protein